MNADAVTVTISSTISSSAVTTETVSISMETVSTTTRAANSHVNGVHVNDDTTPENQPSKQPSSYGDVREVPTVQSEQPQQLQPPPTSTPHQSRV